jgi:Domain of unknown function (DUF4279)
MDQEKWFRASLRISGEGVQPDEIGRLLGLAPTRTHLRGEPRGLHSISPNLVWNDSLWLFQCPLGDDRDPAEHLNWLLDSVESKLSVIKDLAGKCHVDVFCGFSSQSGQGGFTLDTITLQRMARLGVPFRLDLYPPESVEIAE